MKYSKVINDIYVRYLDVRKKWVEIVTRAKKVKLLGSQVTNVFLFVSSFKSNEAEATRQNKMVKVDVDTLFFRTHIPTNCPFIFIF